MKWTLILLLLAFIDPSKIGKVNAAKSEAKTAYERGDFKEAVVKYRLLTDSLGVREDEVMMNLAHSYFQLNDTLNARNAYSSLTASNNSKLRSVANHQLGVLENRKGKFEEALEHFKNALKENPGNEEARYNYEMVKKKLEEKKKEEEKQQQKDNKDQKKDDQKKDPKDNKDQKEKDDKQKKDDKDKKEKEQKDQQKKEQKEKEDQQKKDADQNKESDKKEIPPSVSEKLKEMKMSEDKARMVLEAMKNQEVQYLQQNKRKATKPKSKGKPDW